MKVTLLVNALNEIDGMKIIMPQIKKEWVDQILVVDGQSTDGTADYAKEQGYDVIVQPGPVSMYQAYVDAFPHIKGDVVITFSPDGNSPPEGIPALIEKMKEDDYDMIIGSRYMDGVSSEDDNWYSGPGNWVFTRLINIIFGYKYIDAMVMYRICKKELFEDLGLLHPWKYSLEYFFQHEFCLMPVMSMRAAKRKMKITEIPIDEPARIGGVHKCRHFYWGFLYLLEMVQELVFWNFESTPYKGKPVEISTPNT